MTPPWTPTDQLALQQCLPLKTIDTLSGLVITPALEEHCNDMGHIQVGYLLKLIDFAGTTPVFRLVDGAYDFVTASLDRTSFTNRINAWEYIILESRITKVFTSSAEVQVKVYALDVRAPQLVRRSVATAYLIYVARSEAGKVVLPALPPQSVSDYHRANEAALRRKNRLAETKKAPFYPIQADDEPFVMRYEQAMTRRETNAQGNVFGGVILKIVGRVSQLVARQQALEATVVGASIDRMNFIEPAFVGETIRAKALVTQTWRTSIEVQVEVYSENPNYPGVQRQIATSTVVYVRLNDHTGEPAPVPPWQPQTETQQLRAGQADLRREIRLKEKADAKAAKAEAVPWWIQLQLGWRQWGQKLLKCWVILTCPSAK